MTQIEAVFAARTPRSAALQQRAQALMPGGDTRTSSYHPPYPLTIERGEGPHVVDVDGNRYVDLIGNFTSLVHGNAYPPIVDAVRRQLERGTAWPARNEAQLELAELLTERVASVEQVRFCNSGTEATMLAAYVARAVTGRRKVLMARYGYHGSLEEYEVGFLGHGGPDTLLATHGDAEDFERVLADRGREIACVVLEPVMGSAGLIASPPGFLARVADAAHRAGALFVADEVITLRLGSGGAQALHGVRPDLTAMGKIIGGGLAVGALGGRADLLAVTHPDGPKLIHSGTFNGNPLTAAAGVVSVRELTSDRIGVMEGQAERLAQALTDAAAARGLPFSLRQVGSMLQLFFTDTPPEANVVRTDGPTATRFHLAALNHGVFFAGRGLMALSTVVDDALLDEAVDRLGAALDDLAAASG
jgi:glutamate-1-semialdehyde 2,1-aminomutase